MASAEFDESNNPIWNAVPGLNLSLGQIMPRTADVADPGQKAKMQEQLTGDATYQALRGDDAVTLGSVVSMVQGVQSADRQAASRDLNHYLQTFNKYAALNLAQEGWNDRIKSGGGGDLPLDDQKRYEALEKLHPELNLEAKGMPLSIARNALLSHFQGATRDNLQQQLKSFEAYRLSEASELQNILEHKLGDYLALTPAKTKPNTETQPTPAKPQAPETPSVAETKPAAPSPVTAKPEAPAVAAKPAAPSPVTAKPEAPAVAAKPAAKPEVPPVAATPKPATTLEQLPIGSEPHPTPHKHALHQHKPETETGAQVTHDRRRRHVGHGEKTNDEAEELNRAELARVERQKGGQAEQPASGNAAYEGQLSAYEKRYFGYSRDNQGLSYEARYQQDLRESEAWRARYGGRYASRTTPLPAGTPVNAPGDATTAGQTSPYSYYNQNQGYYGQGYYNQGYYNQNYYSQGYYPTVSIGFYYGGRRWHR